MMFLMMTVIVTTMTWLQWWNWLNVARSNQNIVVYPASRNKKLCDKNSIDNEEALQVELELFLVVELVEHHWLKIGGLKSWITASDIDYLEYQQHPADAEGDGQGQDEGEDPRRNHVQNCFHKWRRCSKGLNAQYCNALVRWKLEFIIVKGNLHWRWKNWCINTVLSTRQVKVDQEVSSGWEGGWEET